MQVVIVTASASGTQRQDVVRRVQDGRPEDLDLDGDRDVLLDAVAVEPSTMGTKLLARSRRVAFGRVTEEGIRRLPVDLRGWRTRFLT